MAVLVTTMACKVSDGWLLIESNSLAGARAAVVCEQLTAELCAFAVSSALRRCVLENTHRAGRPTVYQCRTSEVVVEDARLAGLVETDRCVRACGVDRATVGISSDSLLDPRVAGAVCSPACLQGCPNIVDLYSNLAAGEGKRSILTIGMLFMRWAFCNERIIITQKLSEFDKRIMDMTVFCLCI